MCKSIILVFLVIFLCISSSSKVYAVYSLDQVMARVNANFPEVSTEMSVSFLLPMSSPAITRTDYIQIYLAEWTGISAPTYVKGDFAGNPAFSVSGQYTRVSNIRVLPNHYIEIGGIQALAPGDENLLQVQVFVTEDEAGTQVKNAATVIATRNYGSVEVSATIPAELASLVISGYASPEMFLVFSESNVVMGTDVTNPLGMFARYFSGLQPTTHNISFYGIDRDYRTTSPVSISIYTPAFQQTTISNQLLSPTIEIDKSLYLQGDTIIATGSALPNENITLFTDNPLRSYEASSAANGEWTHTISNTSQYIPGDYQIYAIAQNQYGLQSLTSPSSFFSIRTTESAGTACGDISQGDLNCDGLVNLIDFSILMYYWATTNPAADVNTDLLVNLTDFSVLMYYWGT